MTAVIGCWEQGADAGEGPAFAPDPADLARLQELEGLRVIQIRSAGDGRIRVLGRESCGRVSLPSGAALEIRSKVPILALIEWLAYVDELPALRSWSDGSFLARCGRPIEAIAALFLLELRHLTRFHLRPGFEPATLTTSTPRGRLEVRRLAARAHRLPAMPYAFRARTLDTVANRVLARAFDVAVRALDASASDETAALIAWLTRTWSDIARGLVSLDEAVGQVVGRAPIGYRDALQMAALLLQGGVLTPVAGVGGDCFLVNLGVVWQMALHRMVSAWALARGHGVPVERTRYWDDGTNGKPEGRLQVDILVLAARPLVLDAKYKLGFGREAPDDRNQITTYGLFYEATIAALVYPSGRTAARRRLLRARPPDLRCDIYSIELPMALGPARCAAAAFEMLDAILLESPSS